MSAEKPLSCLTWESILKHMSPGTRIPFAQRCPQIRKLDDRLPLKVQNLHVNKTSIKMDDLTYQLGVIQIYHGITPSNVRSHNNAGGSENDEDCYGDSEVSNERIKERRLDTLYQELQRLQNTEEEEQSTDITKLHFQRLEQKVKELQAEIEDVEQNGYIPPYTHYLQFIATVKQEKSVERFIYNKKISDAFGYLMKKMIPRTQFLITNLYHKTFFEFSGFPYLENWTQQNGTLYFKDGLWETFVKECLRTNFTKEKHLSLRVPPILKVPFILKIISRNFGAQMSDDRKSVTVSRETFNIKFFWGKRVEPRYSILHAVVKTN